NRMNIYTVGAATQGLSNYLKVNFSYLDEIKVAVAYDSRNNSPLFAETTAKIFAANGIKVFLFDALRPTPELSFAIRQLDCQSGIVITASHNPKEYNGYKAYWSDGSQVVPPHDGNIIREVAKVKVDNILFEGNPEKIIMIGKDLDEQFLEKAVSVSLSPDAIQKHKDLKIVYTPIHGTGVKLIPEALARMGFTNVIHVPEQDVVSGDFPTVISPNPEETAAMGMAIAKAKEVNADIVMASDPDADRIGVVLKNDKGEYVVVNGNQTALLFLYYIITRRKESGDLKGTDYIVKTIVTSELIADIAKRNRVELFDTYTGFKYIAEVIRENENKRRYIGGGEESYGFLPADFVRDKDAVTSCALMAEIAAWAKDNGKTLYEMLQDIYLEYGFSKEKMKYVVKKGKEGADLIKLMMKNFRSNPPRTLGGSRLLCMKDYLFLTERNLIDGEQTPIELNSTSDVLQFFTEDGTKISVRPSGTEPKIKFYIEVRSSLSSRADYDRVDKECEEKIEAVVKELVKE
ncbi:MAG: phospho-sugar mutase, partial [Bacteroidota bacterium]|nr:phospho-sugar mutase [Bacteroidota bacterium]